MRTRASMILLAVLAAGCAPQAKPVEISTVRENMASHMANLVRLEGTRVERNRYVIAISIGPQDYFVLEDESGRIRVWYNTSSHRCPPRLGAHVTVVGKVVEAGHQKQHLFAAKSISVVDEPPLAENEVRLCQLSRAEAEIFSRQGPDELLAYWRAHGKPERKVVHD